MKQLFENWNSFINESKSGPFEVVKRDKKVRGRMHYTIVHTPSDKYIPSHLYNTGKRNAQGLANELNAYNSSNDGALESPDLASDEATLKTILDIIAKSKYKGV